MGVPLHVIIALSCLWTIPLPFMDTEIVPASEVLPTLINECARSHQIYKLQCPPVLTVARAVPDIDTCAESNLCHTYPPCTLVQYWKSCLFPVFFLLM